ncbi:uncharacterized protein [Oscarella lobularis]|uniref:uncharacterized protein isoform X2 n=1 Tax=Oscarella lobularis TaxID=121494 RepID=UPI00331315F2
MATSWQVAVLVVSHLMSEVVLVPLLQFYESQPAHEVLNMTFSDDSIRVDQPLSLYEASASMFYVYTRGFITLGMPYTHPDKAPSSLPWRERLPLISVYWTNLTAQDQKLHVRKANDPLTLSKFAKDVQKAFPDFRDSFDLVTVATWRSNVVPSFQCVLGSVGRRSFAVFLYEGGEIDDTSNNETSPQQTENAIIGFDDGFNNSWMPRTIANNIGNRIGNVPPRRGVYVLDFNISACTADQWSSNKFCSIYGQCYEDDFFNSFCFVCDVLKSRFSWVKSQCDDLNMLQSPYLIAMFTVCGVLILSLSIVGGIGGTRVYRTRETAAINSSTSNGNSENGLSTTKEPLAEAKEPRAFVNKGAGVFSDGLLQTNESLLNPATPHSRKSAAETLAKNSTTQASSLLYPATASDLADDPVLAMMWTVGGEKQVNVAMQDLSFEFPAHCLEKESPIAIALKPGSGPPNASSSGYIFTVAPHNLSFEPPVTVRVNSESKAPESSLWKRESNDSEWVLLGDFGQANEVKVNEFCDLCLTTYTPKEQEMGDGYKFHKILFVGRKYETAVTVEVDLLRDACNATFREERDLWIEQSGNQICLLHYREILCSREGEFLLVMGTAKEDEPWTVKHEGREIRKDYAEFKAMGTRSNLATWHLYPKEGITPEEAFGQRYPCKINVMFQSQGLGKPHTANAPISTLFGQRIPSTGIESLSMNFENSSNANVVVSPSGKQRVKVQTIVAPFPAPTAPPAAAASHSLPDQQNSTEVPVDAATLPSEAEFIAKNGSNWDIVRAISFIAGQKWRYVAFELDLDKAAINEIRTASTEPSSLFLKTVETCIAKEPESLAVGRLLGICDSVGIERKLIERSYRLLLSAKPE